MPEAESAPTGLLILYVFSYIVGITWAYYGTAYFFKPKDDDDVFKKPDE